MLVRSAPRIMLYNRHSTVLQAATSSADQVASCDRVVTYLNGTVVGTFLDPELSGYRRDRPGLQQILRAVDGGEVDIIVCEALDRLAHDAEDVVWLARSSPTTAFSCRRSAKAMSTKSSSRWQGCAGGRAYGYKRVIRLDAKGEPVRGLLKIDEAQADVVRRRIYA